MQTADHILEASSGEPDELKGSRPVRRGLRHEVAYMFVVHQKNGATQYSATGILPRRGTKATVFCLAIALGTM